MPINTPSPKLIDIESVQKEYNVDLILLFNDKFPLNVLNYQHQDNRPASTQAQSSQSGSSAATITFTESTPPPSPPSPTPAASSANSMFTNPSAHLPLTAAFSTAASAACNRYQRTIMFHGHTMTTYVCSGLGSNAQRECVSLKALCDILYPHSSIVDKLETKMLRLLRAKNINRFRPQNHQTMNLTRLVDIQDIEKHWNHIEQGMRSLIRDGGDTVALRGVSAPSSSDEHLTASTLDKVEDNSEKFEEISLAEVYKCDKRALEKQMEDDEIPIMERLDKRARLWKDDGDTEQPLVVESTSTTAVDEQPTQKSDENELTEHKDALDAKAQRVPRPPIRMIRRLGDHNNKKNRPQSTDHLTISFPSSPKPMRKKIKLNRKRPTPRVRSSKESAAAWVQKYNIEQCYIRLDVCDVAYKPRKD